MNDPTLLLMIFWLGFLVGFVICLVSEPPRK